MGIRIIHPILMAFGCPGKTSPAAVIHVLSHIVVIIYGFLKYGLTPSYHIDGSLRQSLNFTLEGVSPSRDCTSMDTRYN